MVHIADSARGTTARPARPVPPLNQIYKYKVHFLRIITVNILFLGILL